MSYSANRRELLTGLTTTVVVGAAGCVNSDNNQEDHERKSGELLYVILTSNLPNSQKIKIKLEQNGEIVLENTYELPEADISRQDVPGSTPPRQYMIERTWDDSPANFVLKLKYPDQEEWEEHDIIKNEKEIVGAWVSLWPEPELQAINHPAEEEEVPADAPGDRQMTATEAREWAQEFLEDQGDREYGSED